MEAGINTKPTASVQLESGRLLEIKLLVVEWLIVPPHCVTQQLRRKRLLTRVLICLLRQK